MKLKIVLYAEGAGDIGGVVTTLPAAGMPLREEHLGPAHALVQRCAELSRRVPHDAIEFLSPLLAEGRIPRGSDLLSRPTLRRLLLWPRWKPDLAIVLDEPTEPESMEPGRAKTFLNDWMVRARPNGASSIWDKERRRTIARSCDLSVLARRCKTFETFLRDIAEAT